MWPFYLLILIIFFGFSAVMKVIWDEHRKETGEKLPSKKEAPVTPVEVLQRSGLNNPTEIKSSAAAAPSSSVLDKIKSLLPLLLKKKTARSDQGEPISPIEASALAGDVPQTGTASIRLDPSSGKPSIRIHQPAETPAAARVEQPIKKADPAIDKEVELSIQNDELKNQFAQLQERYDKLDKLFIEKSESLERTLNDLEHEQKNRKEFNKVKDLLEKEIKDSKDIAKKAEAGLNSIKSESTTYTARITQLEEKIKKLEGELYAKEDLLEEQSKKITQLSSASKMAAASRPATEPKIEEKPPEAEPPAPVAETPSPEQHQEPIAPASAAPDTTTIEAPAKPNEQQPADAKAEYPSTETPVLSQQPVDHESPQDTAAPEPPVQQPSSEDDSAIKKKTQPPEEPKERTKPLELPASPEYLSLLGATSSMESEDAAVSATDEEFSTDETDHTTPSPKPDDSETPIESPLDDTLENFSNEPALYEPAESLPAEQLGGEISETPSEGQPSSHRNFDDLLLKPLSAPDEEPVKKETIPDAPASQEMAEEEQQDLPEPPPQLSAEQLRLEGMDLQKDEPDDLPPLTPAEELSEMIVERIGLQNTDDDAAPAKKEPPTEEPAYEDSPNEQSNDDEENLTFTNENQPPEDPDMPHLTPDIFKDLKFELEEAADSKNKENQKDETNP